MNKNQFQTIPLSFRIWDVERQRFITVQEIYPNCTFSKETANRIILDVREFADALGEFYFHDSKDNYIISQDTGLKDKNGKSIFTGDIIESYGENFVVFYNRDSAHIMLRSVKNGDCGNTLDGMDGVEDSVLVVGNIWQNPELLN